MFPAQQRKSAPRKICSSLTSRGASNHKPVELDCHLGTIVIRNTNRLLHSPSQSTHNIRLGDSRNISRPLLGAGHFFFMIAVKVQTMRPAPISSILKVFSLSEMRSQNDIFHYCSHFFCCWAFSWFWCSTSHIELYWKWAL